MSSDVYQNILDMWSRIDPPKGDMVWACLTPKAEEEMQQAIRDEGNRPRMRVQERGKATLLGYRNGELVEI